MIPAGVQVFVAATPVDFRRGVDGLMALIRDAGADPFSGALYAFRAKRADRVKIVWWDGTGACLFAKRLDGKAQFCWPRIGASRVRLNHAQLLALVVALAEKAGRLADRNAAVEAENVRIRAENVELAALNRNADERIARLMSIIAMFERARYGKRSETLCVDPLSEEQYQFVFDEIDTGLAAISAELERGGGKARSPRAPRPRKTFPAHLEHVEVIIEHLDVTPAKFRVMVTRPPKYAYRGHDGVIQAAAPAHLIEGGIPTEALLAQIAVSKYADGLPLYRQEAIYARDQVELSRSLMAQWMGKVGFELEPLAEHGLARIRQAERIFADETTLPILAPGSGKVKQA